MQRCGGCTCVCMCLRGFTQGILDVVLTLLESAKEHPTLSRVTVLFIHVAGDCLFDLF